MSSSNIIKSRDNVISAFNYTALDTTCERTSFVQGEFFPLAGNQQPEAHQPVQETDRADDLVAEPVVSESIRAISEDELDQRLLDAFERGVQEGRKHAEKGLANVFKSFRDAAFNLSALWEKIVRDSEEDLLKLVVMVARKVIQQEITQDRRILAHLVATAVNGTAERNDIIVRLNPEDYRIFNANRQLYLDGVSEEKNVTLKPDESINPGGCVVDTPIGAIDAQVDVQLDEIYRRLLDERPATLESPRTLTAEVDQYVRSES